MNRRWFGGPKLNEWRMLTAAGKYDGPFFDYPNEYYIREVPKPISTRFKFTVVKDLPDTELKCAPFNAYISYE